MAKQMKVFPTKDPSDLVAAGAGTGFHPPGPGYPSSGCVPAEPDSVSPGTWNLNPRARGDTGDEPKHEVLPAIAVRHDPPATPTVMLHGGLASDRR